MDKARDKTLDFSVARYFPYESTIFFACLLVWLR